MRVICDQCVAEVEVVWSMDDDDSNSMYLRCHGQSWVVDTFMTAPRNAKSVLLSALLRRTVDATVLQNWRDAVERRMLDLADKLKMLDQALREGVSA